MHSMHMYFYIYIYIISLSLSLSPYIYTYQTGTVCAIRLHEHAGDLMPHLSGLVDGESM